MLAAALLGELPAYRSLTVDRPGVRTRYLLTYDIRDPRRLRRVHRVAKDFGEPLQFAVFGFVFAVNSVPAVALSDVTV